MLVQVRLLENANGKGVYLETHDLSTLRVLYGQNLLTQQQLLRVHHIFGEIHDKQWDNKVKKWEKYNLVKTKTHYLNKRYGFKFDTVEITEVGMKLLKKVGLLDQNEKLLYRPKGMNIDHFIATKEAVITTMEVYLELYKSKANEVHFADSGTVLPFMNLEKEYGNEEKEKKKEIYKINLNHLNDGGCLKEWPFYSFEEGQKYYLTSFAPSRLKFIEGLVPDWILQFRKGLFFLEADTGTERFQKNADPTVATIEGKIEKYIELANRFPNYKHHVCFILLDDSITTKGIYTKKKGRIANLKWNIGHTMNEAKLPNNLDILVFSLDRTKEVMHRLLYNMAVQKKVDRLVVATNLLSNPNELPVMLRLLKGKTELERVGVNITKLDERKLSVETAFEVEKKSNKTKSLLLPFTVDEGQSLVSYKLDSFVEAATDRYNRCLPYLTKVLAIYQTKREMIQDILHILPSRDKEKDIFYKNTLLMNVEDWKKQNPCFYTLSKEVISIKQVPEYLDKD